MKFVNNIPVVSLRKDPSEKSELVTQLLFGEKYVVLDRHADWLLVQCEHDQYEGWLSMAQHPGPASNETEMSETMLVGIPLLETEVHGKIYRLPFGSELGVLASDIAAEKLEKWQASGIIVSPRTGSRAQVMHFAGMLINSPYLWGGRNPLGYDCSGFVQVVFKLSGIGLPRDARQQAAAGHIVDFADAAAAGDLAFFENESGQIVHVGITDGEGGIIHCSGYVRHDSLDAHGIFNRMTKRHTHKLRLIKRLLP